MATKHKATSPTTGETFKRTSQNRVYSHAVIIHYAERPAQEQWKAWPAVRSAQWASTQALAERNAAKYRGKPRITLVEIVPAEVVS